MTEEGFRKYCDLAVQQSPNVEYAERHLRDGSGDVTGVTVCQRPLTMVWHNERPEAIAGVFGRLTTDTEAIELFEKVADVSISDELDFLLMQDPNG